MASAFFRSDFSVNAHEPKIYDCFIFFNELEILNIRLHELYDAVDYFVLVESSETFRGQPKPYIFEGNKARFAPFLDKIIHIKVNKRLNTDNPWLREAFQRNQISKGLTKCQMDDIVLISDVDEIPRKEAIQMAKHHFLSSSFQGKPLGFIFRMFAYFLNRPFLDEWKGTVAVPYRYLTMVTPYSYGQRSTPQWTRELNGQPEPFPEQVDYLKDAGWHFTYLGGVEKYKQKWRAYCHGDDHPPTDEEILKIMNEEDCCPIDESFPQYVRDNETYFREIGYIQDAQ